MRCQFDVISVRTSDTSQQPAIVLSYDDKKYLFNCGEGTQRQMIAQKIPMRRIKEIFTTSGWDSHGGLAGLMLGLTNYQAELNLGIHGPRNLAYFLATLRAGQQRGHRYTAQKSLVIEEYTETLPKAFEDSNVIVQPIVILPDSFDVNRSDASLTRLKPARRSLLTDQDLQDPARIANVAHSVWSGQFLEKLTDGTWAALPVTRKITASSTSTEVPTSAKRGRSDSAPDISQPKSKKRVLVDGDGKVPQLDDSSARPAPEKYRAFSQYMLEDLPAGEPYPAAVSYYIQGQPLPGKFDPVRAKALGVSPGPDFGRLQKGFRIITPSGLEVKPEDVMGPLRISSPVVIVDCPNSSYINNLCSHPFWSTCRKDRQPVVMIHSCDSAVIEDPRYVQFMTAFGINVKHFIACKDYVTDSLTNTTAATQIENLRLLSTSIYPQPHHEKEPISRNFDLFYEHALNASVIEPKLQFTPMPYLSITRKEELPQTILSSEHADLLEVYKSQCKQTQEMLETLDRSRNHDFAGAEVEIATLGTGSAGPSSFRNVAATLVMIPNSFSMLLDCGENTIGQFRRLHGSNTADELRRVRLIFISHMHADHHLGLLGFLRAWKSYNDHNDKLFVICPARYSRSIIEYGSIEDIGIQNVTFIDSSHLATVAGAATEWTLDHVKNWQHLRSALPDIEHILVVPAIHSEKSFCIRINHVDGWSVAYSGDTRPCASFAAIGKGVTCLIHEATFEDDMLDEAVKKKHSTISEALQIAKDMQASTTILTHFSQRYPKLPIFKDIDIQDLSARQVGLASDLMRVRIKDIWRLSYHLGPQANLAQGLKKLNIKDSDQEQEELIVVDD